MRRRNVLFACAGLALLLVGTVTVLAQSGQREGSPDGGGPFPFEGDAGDYVGWVYSTVYSTETQPAPTSVDGPALPLQEGSPDGGAPFPFEENAGNRVGWVFSRVKEEGVPGGTRSQGFDAQGGLSWAPARMDAIAETRITYYTGSPCSALVAFARVGDFRKDDEFVGSTGWATEDYCGDDNTANAKKSCYGWVYGHSWSMEGDHKGEENGTKIWGVEHTGASKDL
jgi:hypothetical protein